MRGSVVATLCLGMTVSSCSSVEPLPEPMTEVIQVDTVDLPGRLWDPFMPPLADGVPVTVDGLLSIPATDVKVPAVIITHGCGGIGGAERGWVDDLMADGYAVLLLDSFGPRGISSICSGEETVNVASLIVDLFRSADQLESHPYVDGSRIAVIGFSLGGRTALWSAMTRFQDSYGGSELVAHVALYPSTCFIQLEGETDLGDAPIRIFHGTEDDWTPIDQCQDFVGRLAAAGVDAALNAYPGAHHSFDDETLPPAGTARIDAPSPRNCQFEEINGQIIDPDTGGVAGVGSPCVELGVQYGFNPAAQQAAKEDLSQLLAEVFGP